MRGSNSLLCLMLARNLMRCWLHAVPSVQMRTRAHIRSSITRSRTVGPHRMQTINFVRRCWAREVIMPVGAEEIRRTLVPGSSGCLYRPLV